MPARLTGRNCLQTDLMRQSCCLTKRSASKQIAAVDSDAVSSMHATVVLLTSFTKAWSQLPQACIQHWESRNAISTTP